MPWRLKWSQLGELLGVELILFKQPALVTTTFLFYEVVAYENFDYIYCFDSESQRDAIYRVFKNEDGKVPVARFIAVREKSKLFISYQ